MSAGKRKRLDTKLEAEAAEFLVLAHLLLERIPAFKAYVNHAGYDLLATAPEVGRTARIQVKSRFRTDWDGFIAKNTECDFVVFVALNRGFRHPKSDGETGIMAPEFFVLPVEYVRKVRDPKNAWGKIIRRRLVGINDYKDKWGLIRDHLRGRRSTPLPNVVPGVERQAPRVRARGGHR